jgi:phage terminase small subunit
MPARKPVELHVDDRHKTRRESRERGEDAAMPGKRLSTRPPKELAGLPVAQRCWRYHVRLYSSTKGTILTGFDRDALLEYCRGWADLEELRELRGQAGGDVELFLRIDARLDRKATRLDTLRQQLYLTPRSRAGVAPVEKQPDQVDELDTLLDEVYFFNMANTDNSNN